MSGCEPGPPPPEEIESPPVLVPPPPGPTRLVLIPNEGKTKHTINRECDVVTAMKRGLREYLEQVYIDVAGARIMFQQVFDVWAESDVVAAYPSAAIMAVDEAEYEAASMTPTLMLDPVPGGPSQPSERLTYLVRYSEATVQMVIEVHTTSSEERVAVSMMLEDALNPVDWMAGFRLQLPHYYNAIAVYEPVRVQQMDSEDSSRRRFRPGTVKLNARCSVLRPRQLPLMRPSASVEVADGSP